MPLRILCRGVAADDPPSLAEGLWINWGGVCELKIWGTRLEMPLWMAMLMMQKKVDEMMGGLGGGH